jgi:CubicO group peptidase (beta-lactamase class C family)
MVHILGTVETGFEGVREAFAQAQAEDDGGAQICVYRHGRTVVDLWCGRDPINDRAYTANTISVLMSCSKGLTATVASMLAERGQLDFDAPVADYWPEFAASGKDQLTVSDLLAHRAGLMSFPPESGIRLDGMMDWDRCTAALAGMAPLWTPGTAVAYHAITFGFLVGEVVRRVDGRSVGRFFAEEVAGPLGLDLWIGLPEREETRVAPQFSRNPEAAPGQMESLLRGLGIDLSAPLIKAIIGSPMGPGEANRFLNSRAGHAAEIPAANAVGNARSLARMYAATIGEVDGVRLLRPETVARARSSQTDGLSMPPPLDKLPGGDRPGRYGLGYELSRDASPMLGEGSFGHTGAGGRLGFAHPETGVALGYVCNNMAWDYLRGPDDRWVPWTSALAEAVRN